MITVIRRGLGAALPLTLAATLAACGSATAPTAESEAASKVGDTVELVTLAKDSAAAQQAKKTAHLTMTLSGAQEGTIDADVDYGTTPPAMSMTMDVQGQAFDMLYVDKVLYLGGAAFAEMSGGKKWIKVDPDGDDQLSMMMRPYLDQVSSSLSNPAEQYAVPGVRATVKEVDGDQTTYTMTLTKAQLEQALNKQAEKTGAPVDKKTTAQLPAEAVYEMTLGKGGIPISATIDMGVVDTEIVYSKWGEPVNLKVPAASDVGTFQPPVQG
ncbi:MAG: hypothetical protein ACRCSN_20410 [Dermatophilaceae bacterium]